MEKEKPTVSIPPDLLQQLRHLSIPLWIRIGVVLLVSLVFVGNLGFLVYAFLSHQEKWQEASVTILGSIFLPAVAVVLIKRMADDFLWDPSKQLYFAQDLGFFIASALTEGRGFFAHTR